jgi:hypothetical protein
MMDSHRETKVGIEPPAVNDKVLELEAQGTELEHKNAETTSEVQAVSK